ncbi:esterase-like activity of phytase family protein [[Limnothrix rosea] IAM M-220]|uniref:esterase-like activity of phytase family protein n=1 Tax=[Limnothrix rosea] IAM M-220 TaxID=454133 RepID=UPI00095E9D6E|nr:esterase-like activity of phytase family protein [[Limnothrix rosea] IAM M-220]OKH14598.1 endonuclease/exonuclease/phosphatase [[Limnothrix rosea] IAM M-220]
MLLFLGRSPRILTFTIACFFSLLLLSGCTNVTPQPAPTNPRTFLSNLTVEFLDEYHILDTSFQDTKIGGLSAINYDPRRGVFYALSDDRSNFDPARFYELSIKLDEAGVIPQIESVNFEKIVTLTDAEGNSFSRGTIDPEGLSLSPRNSLFIASEGVTKQQINPFVKEFNLNGQEIDNLRIPERFLPLSDEQGVQDNLGFEALSLSTPSIAPEDPFRLFVAPESSLTQDNSPENISQPIRFLHYVINPIGNPVLIGEHLYPLEPTPEGVVANGLVELIALPKEGYLLSLERTYGLGGAGAKLFQTTIGNATDTSRIESIPELADTITPMQKTLLFDLRTIGIGLDNLEGMTLGPKLADGSQSLVLISDNNFSENQVNQVLLFRLSKSAANSTSK